MNDFFFSGSSCVRIKPNFQAHLALEETGYLFLFLRYINKIEIAAGVTPEILDA